LSRGDPTIAELSFLFLAKAITQFQKSKNSDTWVSPAQKLVASAFKEFKKFITGGRAEKKIERLLGKPLHGNELALIIDVCPWERKRRKKEEGGKLKGRRRKKEEEEGKREEGRGNRERGKGRMANSLSRLGYKSAQGFLKRLCLKRKLLFLLVQPQWPKKCALTFPIFHFIIFFEISPKFHFMIFNFLIKFRFKE
jgi:hypothetical protein